MKDILHLIPKVNSYKNGSKIHIKKKNEGKFTDYCGGKVTDECILRALHSSNPKLVKRANFARNARKWKHLYGGSMAYLKYINSYMEKLKTLLQKTAEMDKANYSLKTPKNNDSLGNKIKQGIKGITEDKWVKGKLNEANDRAWRAMNYDDWLENSQSDEAKQARQQNRLDSDPYKQQVTLQISDESSVINTLELSDLLNTHSTELDVSDLKPLDNSTETIPEETPLEASAANNQPNKATAKKEEKGGKMKRKLITRGDGGFDFSKIASMFKNNGSLSTGGNNIFSNIGNMMKQNNLSASGNNMFSNIGNMLNNLLGELSTGQNGVMGVMQQWDTLGKDGNKDDKTPYWSAYKKLAENIDDYENTLKLNFGKNGLKLVKKGLNGLVTMNNDEILKNNMKDLFSKINLNQTNNLPFIKNLPTPSQINTQPSSNMITTPQLSNTNTNIANLNKQNNIINTVSLSEKGAFGNIIGSALTQKWKNNKQTQIDMAANNNFKMEAAQNNAEKSAMNTTMNGKLFSNNNTLQDLKLSNQKDVKNNINLLFHLKNTNEYAIGLTEGLKKDLRTMALINTFTNPDGINLGKKGLKTKRLLIHKTHGWTSVLDDTGVVNSKTLKLK